MIDTISQYTSEVQSFKDELNCCFLLRNFDIKAIPTFGAFRQTQLQVIGNMQIKEQAFKELIVKTLKICPVYDAIISTVHELEENNAKVEQKLQANPNNLLNVSSILRVLHESLFYRHMVKLKVENSETIIKLVNNRSTDLNRRVIIAGLLIYMSKRLTAQEIGTALLMYNLEQALVKLKPYGLPLEQNVLQKYMKKLDRIVNTNSLKNFIAVSKLTQQQLQQEYGSKQNVISNFQYVMGPDQFLFLLAMSQKKAVSAQLLFNKFDLNSTNKQGINLFIQKKKIQDANSIKNLNNSKTEIMESISNSNIQANNYNQEKPVSSPKEQNQKSNTIINMNNLSQGKLKVKGLTLYSKENIHIKKAKQLNEVFMGIKNYLAHTKLPKYKNKVDSKCLKRTIDIDKDIVNQNGNSKDQLNQNTKYHNHERSKSLALPEQYNKRIRPSSAFFKKSVQILNKNQKNLQNFQESLQKVTNNKNVVDHHMNRSKSHYIKRDKTRQNNINEPVGANRAQIQKGRSNSSYWVSKFHLENLQSLKNIDIGSALYKIIMDNDRQKEVDNPYNHIENKTKSISSCTDEGDQKCYQNFLTTVNKSYKNPSLQTNSSKNINTNSTIFHRFSRIPNPSNMENKTKPIKLSYSKIDPERKNTFLKLKSNHVHDHGVQKQRESYNKYTLDKEQETAEFMRMMDLEDQQIQFF